MNDLRLPAAAAAVPLRCTAGVLCCILRLLPGLEPLLNKHVA
jgi:hypothetical protein